MSTIRKESSAAAKFFADLGRHKKRKKKEKKTSTATQSVVTSTQPVSKTPKATDVYQPHTLNKSGKPTRDLTYKYDRSIFGSYLDDNYKDFLLYNIQNDDNVIICLSGRGDKDVHTVADCLGKKI